MHDSEHDGDRLLLTHEVADFYRTTPATIRYWRHIGYGPKGVKVGRHVLYVKADVEAWLQETRAAGVRTESRTLRATAAHSEQSRPLARRRPRGMDR